MSADIADEVMRGYVASLDAAKAAFKTGGAGYRDGGGRGTNTRECREMMSLM